MKFKFTVEYDHVIDSDCERVLANLVTEDSPHPGIQELKELADILQPTLRIIKVKQADQLVGLAICCIKVEDIEGVELLAYRMFGGTLHDYSRIYALNSQSMHFLLKSLRQDAKNCCVDIVQLNGLLCVPEQFSFPKQFFLMKETIVFNSQQSDRGWEGITAKKSVRRHWNKVKKIPDFRVEHCTGEVTERDIVFLSEMHRERWHFDGVSSAFDSSVRINEYLVHPSNKLITRVYLGNEILCCHFGMLYSKTLLWHTPVVNIKFLDLSPLEILLAATAEYCADSSLEIIDLGQGSENYKERFGTAHRTSFDILIPMTIKGMLPFIKGHIYNARSAGLVKIFVWGRRSLRELYSRFRVWLRALKSTIILFETFDVNESSDDLPFGQSFSIIKSYNEYVDFCRIYGLEVLRLHYQRYKEGSFFLVIHDDHVAYSFGWAIRSDRFFVGEIQRYLLVDADIMLFDFYTPLNLRRKGYYLTLLKFICNQLKEERIAIFALSTNVASLSAIRSAGFTQVASHRMI